MPLDAAIIVFHLIISQVDSSGIIYTQKIDGVATNKIARAGNVRQHPVMLFQKQRKKLVQALLELRRARRDVTAWPALVKATGKSDEQFCLDNGLPPASFSRWCRGLQQPGPDTRAKVLGAFRKEGVL